MIGLKKILLITSLILVVAMVGLMVGCDSSTLESRGNDDTTYFNELKSYPNHNFGQYNIGSDIEQQFIFEASELKSSILNSVILSKQTTTGKEWLESQGYTFDESNSVIMIEEEYQFYSDSLILIPLDQPTFRKLNARYPIQQILERADTIVWMTFINPMNDSSLHSAIITNKNNDEETVVGFFEFDISTEGSIVLREGYFSGGDFIPDDIGLANWLECVGAGTVGSAVVCGFLGPGYIPCVGAGAVASAVGCTIYTVWQWFA